MNTMNILFKLFKLILISHFLLITFHTKILNAENIQSVIQSLERIEKDVRDLQKEVYREKSLSDSSSVVSSDNNFSALDIRIRDIENQVRELTSYVEDYVIKIDDLNDRIDDIILKESENIISNNKPESKVSSENVNNQSNEIDDQSLGSLSISDNEIEFDQNLDQNSNILPEGSPDEQYQFARELIGSQELEKAKIALKEFIDKNNDHVLAGSAYYWIGEIKFLQKNYKQAAITFAEGYEKYPNSKKVPDMLYRLGVSLSKLDKKPQACITFNELMESFPDSRLIKKVKIESDILQCQ